MKWMPMVMLLTVTACVDFDERFAAAVARLGDAGLVADAGPPDAGKADAGQPDAGQVDAGDPDAGTPDAGATCTTDWCLESSWTSATAKWSSFTFVASAGIVGASLSRAAAVVSLNLGNDTFSHTLLLVADGGVTATTVTNELGTSPAVGLVGLPDELLVATNYEVWRFVNQRRTADRYGVCAAGNEGKIWGLSSTSLGLATTGLSTVCLLGANDAGRELSPDFTGVYFYGAWVSPSGEVYAAGGNFDKPAAGHLYVLDGGVPVPFPAFEDPDGYGFVAIEGIGNQAWAATRPGDVLYKAAGSNAFVLDARVDFKLFGLHVASATEVWAVGDRADAAVHFDGTAWAPIFLPTPPATTWEHVRSVDGGLILSGLWRSGSDYQAVVATYRKRR